MRNTLFTAAALGVALALGGCTATTESVYRQPDSGVSEVKTTRFQATDLQMIASQMIESLLSSPVIGNERPIVAFGEVKNKTTEHIDTKLITDKIRTQMIKSGKVRFVSDRGEGKEEYALEGALKEQQFSRSKAAAKDTQRKAGKLKAAQYHLIGEINDILQQDSNAKEQYYKMTFNLLDIETGELVWADEKEILKVVQRGVFGR